MNRRHLNRILVAGGFAPALMMAGPLALAQSPAPVEGHDYKRLEPPQPAPAAGKIEVLEFFSYACPHCSAFEPTLQAWAQRLPADVILRRVPVPFLFNAENFQRTYYTLETLGLVDAMQSKIFTAIHADRQRLEKPEEIAALVAKNGGDAAKFLATFKSFSIVTAQMRAKKLTSDYKIESVPTLVIQGRYITSPADAGSAERSLAVVDALIARARKG